MWAALLHGLGPELNKKETLSRGSMRVPSVPSSHSHGWKPGTVSHIDFLLKLFLSGYFTEATGNETKIPSWGKAKQKQKQASKPESGA